MRDYLDTLRGSRRHQMAAAILFVALVIRLWDLNARAVWFDEAMEYWVATSPLTQLAANVRDALSDPPLYSLVLHFWMLPGDGEIWLRLFSALLGTASVLGIMIFVQRLHGWTPAFVAAALLAVFPTAVRYSQEIGQYGPMQCAIVWSLVALLDVARAATPARLARWALVALAGIYTYYGAVVPIMVPFVCVLAEHALQRRRRWVLSEIVTLVVLGVAMLPLLLFFLPHQIGSGPVTRPFEAIPFESVGIELLRVKIAMEESLSFQATGWPCSSIPSWVAIAAILALMAASLRGNRRLVGWFFASWLVYAVMGRLSLLPFGFRYTIILTPLLIPFIVGAFRADAGRLRHLSGAVAVAVLFSACVVSLPNRSIYDRINRGPGCAWPETEDIKVVMRYWSERRMPGHVTYVNYGAAPAFAYYLGQMGERTDLPPTWYLSCWRNGGQTFCHESDIHYGRWMRSLPLDRQVASILETLGSTPPVLWMIFSHIRSQEDVAIVNALADGGYRIADAKRAPSASAVLLVAENP